MELSMAIPIIPAENGPRTANRKAPSCASIGIRQNSSTECGYSIGRISSTESLRASLYSVMGAVLRQAPFQMTQAQGLRYGSPPERSNGWHSSSRVSKQAVPISACRKLPFSVLCIAEYVVTSRAEARRRAALSSRLLPLPLSDVQHSSLVLPNDRFRGRNLANSTGTCIFSVIES